MSRALGRPAPADPRTAAGEIIASAASDPGARAADAAFNVLLTEEGLDAWSRA
ncbi:MULTISPECIES: hypothetical protein [unclassified Spirillospora]|uniref:hypothetical protein n=1 Tax=unclassified Spirillospora TaxID=2642701 RepID=UPI003722568A